MSAAPSRESDGTQPRRTIKCLDLCDFVEAIGRRDRLRITIYERATPGNSAVCLIPPAFVCLVSAVLVAASCDWLSDLSCSHHARLGLADWCATDLTADGRIGSSSSSRQ
ncbi:hypothetical protein E2C01_091928 [Portunus trituberculatus]|uniref:Uncharacterized protein n=1 Tax=Portunus trituberculatus TaxID=210409 RepID=A0A5B7JU67_PORTR|nr:hypothetical protein [Portunus trituberculatus]